MGKYWSIVWRMIDDANVVLEVIDARFPSICRSNRLEQRVMESDQCNLLIAINKADLVPRDQLNLWVKWIKEQGIKSVGVSATQRLGTSILQREILKASNKKTAKVAVVGLPNTGKSSIINRLKGRKSASTAPISGHTKSQQMIRVSKSMMMFDTPGIIPVKLPEKHNILLGLTPVTKIKDPIYAAELLIEQLNEISPGKTASYYEVPDDISTFLDNIAIKLNRIRKGGVPDDRFAAITILTDHVKGKIPVFENIKDPLRFQ
ncbi:MAG: GTPase [Candidatus Heimdallarchaeota archaeon]